MHLLGEEISGAEPGGEGSGGLIKLPFSHSLEKDKKEALVAHV